MKRITSILLTLLMLVMAAACTADPGKTTDTTAAPTTTASADTTAEPETTAPETEYQLPEKDMNKWAFRIINTDPNKHTWVNTTVTVEEQIGETLNDAFYKRNQTLTEKYNFVIEETLHNGHIINNELAKLAQAQEDVYDIYACADSNLVKYLPYLADFNMIPGLQLNEAWWIPDATSLYDINMRQVALAGNMTLATASRSVCMPFNKEIWAERGDPNVSLYDLVRNNEWTFDKYLEIALSVSGDMNGNSQWDQEDLYGMYFGRAFKGYLGGFLISGGVNFTTKNSEGLHTFDLHQNERAINMLTKLINAWQTDGFTYYSSDNVNGTGDRAYLTGFEDNRALFTQRVPHDIINLRSMEQDFGILPMPKYDEKQENYMTPSYGGVVWTLPITFNMDNAENLGIVLEAMAYLTYRDVVPAYLESVVKTRTGRDAESAEMLDIVFSTVYFDYGPNVLFDAVLANSFINTIFQQKSSDVIVSSIVSALPTIENYIKDLDKLTMNIE